MPDHEAARLTDPHTCPSVEPGPIPHVGGAILSGSANVFIEDLKAARGAADYAECKAGGPDFIAQGSGTVLINDKVAARTECKTQHNGVILGKSATVLIGGPTVTVLKISQRRGGILPGGTGAKAGSGQAGGDGGTSKPAKADDSEPAICELESVELSCGDNRAIQSPQLMSSGFSSYQLQVACDMGGDVITVKPTYSKPPCAEHSLAGFSLRAADGTTSQQFPGSPEGFKFTALNRASIDNWRALLFLDWSHCEPNYYELVPHCCSSSGASALQIAAFPTVEASASVQVSFGSSGLGNSPNKGFTGDVGINGSFQVQIKYRGSVSTSISKKLGDDDPGPLELAKCASKLTSKVLSLLESIGSARIEIRYPNISASYSASLAENPDDYRVTLQRSLEVAANPLVAASGKVDILDWLLTVATGGAWKAGRGLTRFASCLRDLQRWLRRANASGQNCSLSLWLELKGSIAGSISHTFNSVEGLDRTSGEISGEVSVSVSGEASAALDAWIVSTKGELKASGTAGIKASFKVESSRIVPGLYGRGSLEWTGIEIEYSVYLTSEGWFDYEPIHYGDKLYLIEPETITESSSYRIWPLGSD